MTQNKMEVILEIGGQKKLNSHSHTEFVNGHSGY